MENIKLLEKLFIIQKLKTKGEVDKYLASFIEEVKMVIAEEGNESLGSNPIIKVYRKYIGKLKKKSGAQYHLLKCSKKNRYVCNYGAFALLSLNDQGLPCLDTRQNEADVILGYIEQAEQTCKEEVRLPSIKDLRLMLKTNKALPKEEREDIVKYDCGKRKPQVNAEILIDMITIFPDRIAWIDKSRGIFSPLFFKFGQHTGVLLPIRKSED